MNALPKGVFTNVLAPFVSARDVGSLSQTCRTLRDRVHALGVVFWTLQISRDFDFAEVAVTWIKEERDPKLAKTCYVAFHFLNRYGLEWDENIYKHAIIPAPVRATFLLDKVSEAALTDFCQTLSRGEKERFYPLLAHSLENASSFKLRPELVKVLANFVASEHSDPFLKGTSIFTFFKRFCRWSCQGAIDRILAARLLIPQQLTLCLRCGVDEQTIQKLLNAGAKPSWDPTLLHEIVDNIRDDETLLKVLRLLIDAEAFVTIQDRYDQTPLGTYLRSERWNEGIIRLLVENGDHQTFKNEALRGFLLSGKPHDFKLIQELGAYPFPVDMDKNTALHRVCWRDLEVVRSLLEAGEDPNAVNARNQTPLETRMHLCKSGEEMYSLLTLFHEFGADFKNHPGILFAVCKHEVQGGGEAVRFLLKQGISFTVTDRYRGRPIQYAADCPIKGDMVKALLEAGESLSVITNPIHRLELAYRFRQFERLPLFEIHQVFWILALVRAGDLESFEEIPSEIQKRHSRIVAGAAAEHPEVIEKFDKFVPKDLWAGFFPFSRNLHHEDALTLIPKLYALHPEWLFHTFNHETVFETIVRLLSENDIYRSHYAPLFHLIKGWIDRDFPKERLQLYGKALHIFLHKSSKLTEMPVETRKELYDALFTQHQIDTLPDAPNLIYRMIVQNTLFHDWEDIKKRLEPLKLEFGTACWKIFPTGEHYPEAIGVLEDMLRFAWERGLAEKTEGTPDSIALEMREVTLLARMSAYRNLLVKDEP